jgi:hypothetical protein
MQPEGPVDTTAKNLLRIGPGVDHQFSATTPRLDGELSQDNAATWPGAYSAAPDQRNVSMVSSSAASPRPRV